jgi:hypothetical protein
MTNQNAAPVANLRAARKELAAANSATRRQGGAAKKAPAKRRHPRRAPAGSVDQGALDALEDKTGAVEQFSMRWQIQQPAAQITKPTVTQDGSC